MNQEEYILCSAIWYKELPTPQISTVNTDKGMVLCGHRHGHIIYQLKEMCGLRTVKLGPDSVGETIQGFLTSKNRFVDRKEAAEIAFRQGQIKEELPILFSENLY